MGPPPQNIQRIDHVAYIIKPGNFDACLDQLSTVLGIPFERSERDDLGFKIGLNWDAGIEIVSPTRQEGEYWDLLEKKGEGVGFITFGVGSFDQGKSRAQVAGIKPGPEIGLRGDEAWFHKFETLRECSLGSIFGINLFIGEVKRRN